MTEKRRRLEELSARSGLAPETHWTREEFLNTEPEPNSRWWVRSLAEEPSQRYGYPQGPSSPREVLAFLAELDPATVSTEEFAIQEFLEPALAGVALNVGQFRLLEGAPGPAAAILRGGCAGDMIATFAGRLAWRLDRGGLNQEGHTLLRSAHDSIPTGEDALWEWIITPEGDIRHVDRKPLDFTYFRSLPTIQPALWVLGEHGGGPRTELRLADTSVDRLAEIDDASMIYIEQGSPLSHLCYEAVRAGRSVVLRVAVGKT